ncbi:GNAT family N-acetyltransferase [Dokdonella koreensis]|uniref:Acetyltransferase n=1 Tax=Dokdonella koreensis DS-123 TaxID=1300342 RepID=A0A160DZD5_9GAMM|nr:GNAT family N-acetyltransferase [Dokdonella koreensis]ANB19553.1 Acetyltransferase [Dokdonella koreensis DS-123]
MAAPALIREARPDEYEALGLLLIAVYSTLEGFPTPREQPAYYRTLADVGALAARKNVTLLVAASTDGTLLGGVVYFGDMTEYGSGGSAPTERNAAGIRLLGVRSSARGRGIGKALTHACIERARRQGRAQVILHTTEAMHAAWGLYVSLGFRRSDDLDFLQEGLPVFGFRLRLMEE